MLLQHNFSTTTLDQKANDDSHEKELAGAPALMHGVRSAGWHCPALSLPLSTPSWPSTAHCICAGDKGPQWRRGQVALKRRMPSACDPAKRSKSPVSGEHSLMCTRVHAHAHSPSQSCSVGVTGAFTPTNPRGSLGDSHLENSQLVASFPLFSIKQHRKFFPF